MIKKAIDKILKYKKNLKQKTTHVECKSKSDTNNNHLKTIQKMPEQNTRKARHQETTEKSHTEHCTRTSDSTHVKVQIIHHGK